MINKRLKMPNFPKFVEVFEIWTARAALRFAAEKCSNYDLEWVLPTKVKGKPPIRKWTIPAFSRGGCPMWVCRHLCSTIEKVSKVCRVK